MKKSCRKPISNWARFASAACVFAIATTIQGLPTIPPAWGQTPPFVMESVLLRPPRENLQVVGGTLASPTDWPSTLTFRTSVGSCTATVVGPQVILTAAHCVTDGVSGGLILQDGTRTRFTCNQHPDYTSDQSADYALCSMVDPMPRPPGGYEVIETDEGRLGRGTTMTLLGFGCQTQGGRDEIYGQLVQGDADIVEPIGQSRLGANYVRTWGRSALCKGDSGGSAYTGGPNRRVAAVNSQSDLDKNSWLSATTTPGFMTWARTWTSQRNIRICGLDGYSTNCRI